MSKIKKIFLTGGTGFVGSHTLRLLLRSGYSDIVGLCRQTSQYDLVEDIKDRVVWVDTHLLDTGGLRELLKSCDVIIHCAARVSFSWKDSKELMETNVEGTASLCQAALEAGISKFIHLSSISALGDADHGPVTEDHLWKHKKETSSYSVSKFFSEQEVWRAHHEGLPMVILNPSVILGPGREGEGTMAIFDKVRRGLSVYPRGASGFVDVRDVARAILLVMESDVDGERYILNGSNESYETLMGIIAEEYGVKKPSRPLSDFMGTLLVWASTVKSWFAPHQTRLTRGMLSDIQQVSSFSADKFEEKFNFTFKGLPEMIASVIRQDSQ